MCPLTAALSLATSSRLRGGTGVKWEIGVEGGALLFRASMWGQAGTVEPAQASPTFCSI